MTSQDQAEEQLDWLHVISEQLGEQNEHLRAIRRHTGVLYALALIGIILGVLALIATLLSSH